MRIATRLVLVLGVAVTAVMVIYGAISQVQRRALLSASLERETAMLARTLQITVDNALRDRRFSDLAPVLSRVLDDRETFLAAVIDTAGRIVAGGPAPALACLRRHHASAFRAPVGGAGWMECGERISWVVLPVRAPAEAIAIGRRANVIERELANSRVRIAITTLVLAAAAALAIMGVLRRTLSLPLEAIMRGVRTLGGPQPPEPIRLGRAGGELRDLAAAFNEMADRLEGKRRTLERQTEEQIALERRLRQSEKFAALGRFTGGVAHELGSPLNVIAMRAEAVAADAGATPRIRRQAREIVAQVDRVAALVRGLRHVARRHPVEVRPVDVAAVATAVAAEFRPAAEQGGVELRVIAPAAPVRVDGDALLLGHAVGNLVANALHALRERPGTGRITLEVARDGADARIVVEDNGPGIAPEHLPYLFDPFFTTKDVGEGMGLGLAITLGIAEEHGGTVVIAPRPEGGVRATMTIPLAADAPVPVEAT
ncbi:MAG TPA: HAMP domain-containing sensor histidine kinase [Longimicrobiales bacterium]